MVVPFLFQPTDFTHLLLDLFLGIWGLHLVNHAFWEVGSFEHLLVCDISTHLQKLEMCLYLISLSGSVPFPFYLWHYHACLLVESHSEAIYFGEVKWISLHTALQFVFKRIGWDDNINWAAVFCDPRGRKRVTRLECSFT